MAAVRVMVSQFALMVVHSIAVKVQPVKMSQTLMKISRMATTTQPPVIVLVSGEAAIDHRPYPWTAPTPPP